MLQAVLPCLWSHRGCIGTAGRGGWWGDDYVQEYLCNLLSSCSHYVSVWLQDIAGNPDVEKRSKRIKMIKYLFKKKQCPRKRSLMALCLSAVKSWQQRTHLAKLTVFLSYKKKKKQTQIKMMQGNILLSKPNESICAKAKESSWGVCSREHILYWYRM